MPIRYNISPELNIVIYVCRGTITAGEIFKAADLVVLDKRCKPGLITIFDLLFAVENIHLKDIYEAIRRVEKNVESGFMFGPIMLLSRSRGIHILADTIKLLQRKTPFKINGSNTMEDAIISLGLSEVCQEIIEFWQESIALYENS
jgi:hypothetical protein